MPSRITISLTDSGQFEIYLNEEGHKELAEKLMQLNKEHEHLHLAPDDMGDISLSTVAYRKDDKVLEYGKIYLRPDDWDRQYFPHVISD